jgi:hypothetical protein
MSLLREINVHLNGDRCPSGDALGECAAISTICGESGHLFYVASLYLWHAAAELTAAEVARWFTAAGCEDVQVAHVLHDPGNDVYAGRGHDGVRPWDVTFTLPAGRSLDHSGAIH